MRKLYSVLSFLLITSLITFGQVPQTTSFQGVLADSEGSVLSDGTYSLNFKLYDATEKGTLLWEEIQVAKTVSGIFSVILGKVKSLDLPFDKPYWLEISIDGGDPLLPRVELTSSAYSLNTKAIPDNIVTGKKVADGNLVRSINTLKDNVTLAAGSNVVITETNNTITISSTGGGTGDNLGDHTATQNIKLNGKYLSGDGGNEGVFVTNTGKVGIGTTNPNSLLSVGGDGNSGYGISAEGITGGIRGVAETTGDVTNFGGNFYAAGNSGYGVYSTVSGTSGRGVYGRALNTGDVINYGGFFIANGTSGRGVLGTANGTSGRGVYGTANGTSGQGVYGLAGNTGDVINYGGYFRASGEKGRGVFGAALNSGFVENYGGYFTAAGEKGCGVYGLASNTSNYTYNYGGYFESKGTNGLGVYSIANGTDGRGVEAHAFGTNGIAIFGAGTYRAGHFSGNVYMTRNLSVNGTLSKGGGSFKIDHPLDPQNKNLYHSFVESPDMKNIYDGNVTTDANGNAIIELPEWFEALNKDFRYQLTVVGEFAQAIVYKEINNNHFSIKTDKPNIKVSWQVTGIRQDPFANSNRIPVEEMKKPEERGKYLHPKAFGMPETMSVDYDEKFEEEKIRMEQQEAEMEKINKEEEQRLEEERTRMEQEEAERMRIEENQLKIKND
ncbi:MAG: hypothetical protein ABFS12_15350 [Bacteroidota bacterium]